MKRFLKLLSILCVCALAISCNAVKDFIFNDEIIDKEVLGNKDVFNPYNNIWGYGDMLKLYNLTFETELKSNITDFVEIEDAYTSEQNEHTTYSSYVVIYKFDKYGYLYNNWKKSEWIRNQFIEICKEDYKLNVSVQDIEIVLMNASVKNGPIYVLSEIIFDKDENFVGHNIEKTSSSLLEIIDYVKDHYKFD